MTKKTLVFGDMHFGIRGDSKHFLDYQKKISEEMIFPFIDENFQVIEKMIFLGDIFDKRRQINVFTLGKVKDFFDKINEYGIPVYIIIGNHDTFFKNTNEINSPFMIFDKYENITVIDKIPVEDGNNIYCPWINDSNREQCMKILSETQAKYVFGHFEINNAQLLGNTRCDFGIDDSFFNKFKYVFSGHFHFRQAFKNILYTGCLWELSRDDVVQTKGFFVLEKENGEIKNIEFVPITDKYKIFHTITYEDELKPLPNEKSPNFEEFRKKYENTFVKVIIKSCKNKVLWAKFLSRLEALSPAEIVFVDNTEDNSDGKDSVEEFIKHTQNTDLLDVVKYYLDESFKDSPEKVKEIFEEFKKIYQESLENEVNE